MLAEMPQEKQLHKLCMKVTPKLRERGREGERERGGERERERERSRGGEWGIESEVHVIY